MHTPGRRASRDRTRMIVRHRRVTDRATLLNVSAGWHMHLDILVARCIGMISNDYRRNSRASGITLLPYRLMLLMSLS
jgi:hypothetical protein